MTTELKPCPFCGKPGLRVRLSDSHGQYVSLGCSEPECIAHQIYDTKGMEDEEAAIAAWNQRAGDADTERLDWLDKNRSVWHGSHGRQGRGKPRREYWMFFRQRTEQDNSLFGRYDSLRAAIDAARKDGAA